MNNINSDFMNQKKYVVTRISPIMKVNNDKNKQKDQRDNRSFNEFLNDEIKKNNEDVKVYCKRLER